MQDDGSREQFTKNPWFIAFRIAAIYAAVGAFWILFSDELVSFLVQDRSLLTRLSIAKGLFYVAATGLMLYWLVLRSMLAVHRSERSLHESESQLRHFIEHTPAAVAMFDKNMCYLVASRRWLTDYRLGDRNIIGLSHYEVFPEIPERWKVIHQHCLAGAVETADEDPFIRGDGSVDWLRWEVRPWWTPEGKIGGIIMFTEVITNQKLASEAIARNEERLANILETVPSGVTMIDITGRITFANPAAEGLFGLRREDLVGKPLDDHVWRAATLDGSPVPDQELPAYRAMRTGAAVYAVELMVERPDHSKVVVSINSAPITDSSGKITGAVTSISDITERKRADAERKERIEHDRQIREDAEEAKRQFYKGTIFSITDGKLNLVAYDEIKKQIDRQSREITIGSAADLAELRDAVEALCKQLGMTSDRMQSLVIAVGEAAANAVKHAAGGIAWVGEKDGRVQVAIRDYGPGMDALILPRATLLKGFSTKPSLGLGYMLILESVDSIYLATEKRGTWILMEKVVKEPAQDVTIDMLLNRMPDVW